MKIKFRNLISLLFAVLLLTGVFVFVAIAADIRSESVVVGDVNADDNVDIKDLILLRQYFANYDYETQTSSVHIGQGADVNSDGAINLADVVSLRQGIAEGIFTDTFVAEETDGVANVQTSKDLAYNVSSYDSIEENGFAFVKGLTFDFGDAFAASFNRFTVKYSSSAPVKIYVGYVLDGAATEDYYFLEAGNNKSFSGLIPTFLDGKYGAELASFRVDTCENKNAQFVIFDLSTEQMDIPERNYCISGSRYTLGIDLGWGGTINYVSDNQCPISGVENMINKHDTGRLVQQSYYGTGETEGCDFVWGSFNGSSRWPYNPVQGGCQGNLSSRLVDFVVEENYVYIKAQPMDWGKNGNVLPFDQCITPSYMENWYIIEDDYIKVDNRFVDFSGWEHPINGQELPAFYTISYLDSFVWYDGVEPWTGDELSWRHELRFWGNSEYAGECSFRIKEPNTETWCAWVSTEDNYGIGLYTPNIDRYSAGRASYVVEGGTGTSGSKDASANPTNYVAPWKQKQIVTFEAFEFSYLICAGSVDEIRATFTENKDIIDNASLSENSVSNRRPYYEESMESMDFTVEGNEKFVAYPNYTDISYDHTEQALKLLSSGGDAHLSFDYLASPDHPLTAEDYKYLEIEYMIPETNGKASYDCQIFLCAGTRTAASESDSVRLSLIKDGNYHTLLVRLSDKEYWTGNINLIRFDYFGSSDDGDIMYIKSFKLSNEGIDGMDKIDFTLKSSHKVISKAPRTNYGYDSEEGAMRLTVNGNDPSVYFDYTLNSTALSADNYTKLRITYMVPAGQSRSTYSYAVFICAGDVTEPTADASIAGNNAIVADGEYHTIEIDLSQYSFWTGNINLIRFDYFNEGSSVAGETFYITSFELIK